MSKRAEKSLLPLTSRAQDQGARRREARRQLIYEVLSGTSGLALALFMWGHLLLVGSFLTGERGFDWVAVILEDYFIAQPTAIVIFALFLIHAVMASRKIPSQLRERRQMLELGRGLNAVGRGWPKDDHTETRFQPHLDSVLWIWQVRTGMIVLVLGSFHLIIVGVDIFTALYGERVGIEAATSLAREHASWPAYLLLLLSITFHANVGLYRLAIKWGIGSRLTRVTLQRLEYTLLFVYLGIGLVTFSVLSGWLDPPLAFLLEG